MPSPVLLQALPFPGLPADTAAVADTLSIGDRIRADTAWVQTVRTPTASFDSLRAAMETRVLDPALWLGFLGIVVKMVLIVALAVVVLSLVRRAAERYAARFARQPDGHSRRQRVATLANLSVSAARYVVWPLTFITLLGEVGVNVGALLATAGVAGLAIGFGAQTLVRDVISGFFLLFDDSLHVGDTVRIGTDEGTVEQMGVRLLKVRKFNGELLMVPAGELRVFGNRSIGFARAIVDVTIPYDRPAAPLLETMQRVADAWADAHPDVQLDERPSVLALTEFGAEAARARIVARVTPGAQFAAERDLRLALLDAFDDDRSPMVAAQRPFVIMGASEVGARAPGATAPEASAPGAPDPSAPSTSPLASRDPRGPSDPPSAATPTEG